MLWYLGYEAKILAPWPGIEPAFPALKGEVLTNWTTREVPKLLNFKNYK